MCLYGAGTACMTGLTFFFSLIAGPRSAAFDPVSTLDSFPLCSPSTPSFKSRVSTFHHTCASVAWFHPVTTMLLRAIPMPPGAH